MLAAGDPAPPMVSGSEIFHPANSGAPATRESLSRMAESRGTCEVIVRSEDRRPAPIAMRFLPRKVTETALVGRRRFHHVHRAIAFILDSARAQNVLFNFS